MKGVKKHSNKYCIVLVQHSGVLTAEVLAQIMREMGTQEGATGQRNRELICSHSANLIHITCV